MIGKLFLLTTMVIQFSVPSSYNRFLFFLTDFGLQFLIVSFILYALKLFPGLELLLELLESTSSKQHQDGSAALYKLATKGTSLSSTDAAPLSPTPQVLFMSVGGL